MMTFIPLSFASLQTQRSVPRETNAEGRITELKDCITKTSIKPSFVIAIPIRYNSVSTQITAHLRILSKISRWDYCIIYSLRIKTSTSTYSSSKQSGVPSTTNITKHNAFTPTTFKTFDVSLTSFHIWLSSARIGSQELSSPLTTKVARDFITALILMGGKSSSFILSSIKLSLVKNRNVLKGLSVLFITPLKTRETSTKY